MQLRFVVPAVLAMLSISGCVAPTQSGGVWGNTPANSAPSMGGSTGVSSVMPLLVQILMQQLGISQPQAMGGLGSIFSVAQQQLTPFQFGQLSSSVPEMNQYLNSAPAAITTSSSGSAGLLGSAVTALGGRGTALGSAASLMGAFQSLGMNSDMVGRFVPIVMGHLQSQGGPSATALLQNALQ